jgi:DNA-directed RNA polymerase specialized sigma24 family protein
MNRAEAVDRLEGAGLLTERQAEAFVRVEFDGMTYQQAAESLGVKRSSFDGLLSAARSKVSAAQATVDAVDAMHGYQPEADR